MKRRYRKKPVVIEAAQYQGTNGTEIEGWSGGEVQVKHSTLVIATLEGEMIATVGDWIIKGVAGEFYPCKPDIFDQTYEAADQTYEAAD